MTYVAGLNSLTEHYRAVFLDAFGVLYSAGKAVEGTAKLLKQLRESGLLLRVLTNNASLSSQQLADKFLKLGFDISAEEIITSGQAIFSDAGQQALGDQPYLFMGRSASVEHYAPNAAEKMVNYPGRQTAFSQAEALLICSDSEFYGTPLQTQIEAELAQRPRPIILANPDLITPAGTCGLEMVAGMTAHMLVEQYGGSLLCLGKPFPPIYQMAIDSLPTIPRNKILMVGDTLETDILGGCHMGLDTCLVHHGIYHSLSHDELVAMCQRQGIHPSWIVPTIAG
ncbi:HAD-IIA family hydrolase [Magnetococcus sp. PR-3]|uniref:HAD-IIA family hydrolase n=1 Tax=Magnetococcus sp. PR-3 TaxID=3120355 RepID=UPI002FCDE35F